MPIEKSSQSTERIQMKDIQPMLEAIYKNPNDINTRKALKDWLVAREHPWGEYLAMIIEIEEIEDVKSKDKRHTALLLDKRQRFESGTDGTPSKELQQAWLPVVTNLETSLSYGHSPYTWEQGVPMMDVWVTDPKHIKSMKQERTDLLPIGRITWPARTSGPKAKDVKTILESPQTKYLHDLGLDPADDACLLELAASENAQSIRSLHIGGSISDAGIQAIASSPHLAKLEWLMISGYLTTPMTDAKMEALMNATFLPNLKKLFIYPDGVTKHAVELVAKAINEGRLKVRPKFGQLPEIDDRPIDKQFEIIAERKEAEKRRVADLQLDTTGKLQDILGVEHKYVPISLKHAIGKTRFRLSQIRDLLSAFDSAIEADRDRSGRGMRRGWRGDRALEQVRTILAEAEATNTPVPSVIIKKFDELAARIKD